MQSVLNARPAGAPENLRAALAYAEQRGWRVFPVHPTEKRPLIRDWRARASSDPAVIQRLFRGNHRAGVGLATGDGLIVVDVDCPDGAIDPAWPATLRAQTPSGGSHLLYHHAGVIKNSVRELAPGVDVRGDGGLIVIAPTPGYQWVNDAPIAELPPWMADAMTATPPRSRPGGGRRFGPPFAPRASVGTGERNSYLMRAGGFLLWSGVDAYDIEDVLQAHNRNVCQPPLDDDEVAQIAKSVMRYAR